MTVEIQIPDKLEMLFRPKRIKVAFGGRGGAKSVSFAKALLFMARQEMTRVLCLREYMNSLDDSVHELLKTEVHTLKMADFFKIGQKQIAGSNRSLFRYMGLSRNLGSLKSKYGFRIAWVEEAETISERSLDVLIPTMRELNSEIWFSFNPEDEFGAVYSRFVKPYLPVIDAQGYYEDNDIYVVNINLDDNPFAPDELLKDSANMKRDNYKKWLHIYGGKVYSDYQDSIIQPEWFESAIDAHLKLGFEPMGVVSTGFDPADTGDAKALATRQGPLITRLENWEDGELPDAIKRAFGHAYDDNAEFLVYDADGMGASMKVYLDHVTVNKGMSVEPYHGGGAIKDPDDIYADGKTNRQIFRNLRSQRYRDLADRFEATHNAVTRGIYTDPERLICISSECDHKDTLKSELIKIKRVRGNNSYYQIQSKKDAMKEGLRSPNLADALKMCFANPAPLSRGASPNIDFGSEF